MADHEHAHPVPRRTARYRPPGPCAVCGAAWEETRAELAAGLLARLAGPEVTP